MRDGTWHSPRVESSQSVLPLQMAEMRSVPFESCKFLRNIGSPHFGADADLFRKEPLSSQLCMSITGSANGQEMSVTQDLGRYSVQEQKSDAEASERCAKPCATVTR